METLTGVLDDIIFHNNQNDYTVALFNVDDDPVTVTGVIPGAKPGLFCKLHGDWIHHPTYGEQFKLLSFELATPTSAEGILRYLASGVLPGIGEKTAAAIVKRFGEDTLNILDTKPKKLLLVPGIGEKTLKKIIDAWNDGRDTREIILALQEYGIPAATALRLYRTWGEKTVSILMGDPYRMIRDISGIGFASADEIAAHMGIAGNHPGRISAGIIQTLRECYLSGSTCMPREEMTQKTAELLSLSAEEINPVIDDMCIEGSLHTDILEDEEVFYPTLLFRAEDTLALGIVRLLSRKENWQYKCDDLDTAIHDYEKSVDLTLDDDQRNALKVALRSPMAIITGGPGTGKTTIINGLVQILKDQGFSVALAAPTGRAAKRMGETTGEEAKTIHRLLEYTPVDNAEIMTFGRDEENPITDDVVILDESSMIDIMLMAAVLQALSSHTRLYLVGDADQLPSIGPGQVLRDLITLGDIPVMRLTAIHRQAKGSAISAVARSVNAGEIPQIPDTGDVHHLERTTTDAALGTILSLARHTQNADKNIRMPQVITPMKKGPLGTINLNSLLQNTLNPPAVDRNEIAYGTIVFREGDRVMQIKNDYQLQWTIPDTDEEGEGVFNGDLGQIIAVEKAANTIVVRMDDDGRIVHYAFDQFPLLTHAWAMTVHKSQGSEFASVIMPLIAGNPKFLTRRLLYTAMTRAKRRLILVGPRRNFIAMTASNYDAKRRSGLLNRIRLYQSMQS